MPNSKEYMKTYRENNKDKIKAQRQMYYKKNKKQIKEYAKDWRENNTEQIKEYQQSDKGKKINRINNWKLRGISEDYDFDTIYDIYIDCNICDYCSVQLVEGSVGDDKKCLDHDHLTGEIRGILCNSCNCRDVLK